MKLAAVEYLVRRENETATFELARRLGLAGVEIQLSREQLRAEPDRLARLKAAKAATDLDIPALMLGHLNLGGLASADPETVREAKEDVRLAIDWAAQLGVGVILVPFFFRGDIVGEDAFERTVAGFRELCPLAGGRGIKLCYEGTLPAADIRRMVGAVNDTVCGCYFDLANVVWRGQDTATEIRGLAGLIDRVHIKETRVGPGDVRPGLGQVDYAESAQALAEISYDGWLTLETPGGPSELVARDISFTRRWFPSIPPAQPWPQVGAFSYGFKAGEWDRLRDSFKAAGLSAVQIGSDLLQEALDQPDRIPDRRRELEANGITVTALAGYRNLVATDEGQRRANIDFLKRCLEIAPHFGTSVVATETGTRHPNSDWTASPANWDKEAWDLLHAALDELVPVAKAHGSILALEGYVNNVLQTTGQLRGVLERYNTPHLQAVLDPFNYLSQHLLPARERLTARFLTEFEPHFVLAHLKDVGATGAEVDTPEFGQGVYPHQRYFDFLRQHRPDLPLILEHLPFDHIPAAIQRLKQIANL